MLAGWQRTFSYQFLRKIKKGLSALAAKEAVYL
jgi:hypothetical protein